MVLNIDYFNWDKILIQVKNIEKWIFETIKMEELMSERTHLL